MTLKNKFTKLTVLSLLALGTTSFSETANAAGASAAADKMVKCYGIAKKGKNSCTDAHKKHGCAGQSTIDNDPCEYVVTKRSVCKTKNGTETPINCK